MLRRSSPRSRSETLAMAVPPNPCRQREGIYACSCAASSGCVVLSQRNSTPDQGCPGGSYTAAVRPDANSASPSPFLGLPEAEWLCANDLAFAIFDSFPVSPGHVLVITRRVVPTYFDCTAAEQVAVMALVGEVKKLLDERLEPKPDCYNVGFNAGAAAGQTVPHVHVHVIPRYAGDMPDPNGGVRHVIPRRATTWRGPGPRRYPLRRKAPGSRSLLARTAPSGRGSPTGSRARARSTCLHRSSKPLGSTTFARGSSGARWLPDDRQGARWSNPLIVVARIATTAMPRYDAIDLAWAISSSCTARTCSARSVATAIVLPSSAMNSTSYPLPSSCTSTTVPMSPAARPSSGRLHVSTAMSSSSIT
jgi:diadenosine tetraphosphate (Ap4A) HIT family hydrolase